jgi:DNA-binding Lrp family transcriptional regulator
MDIEFYHHDADHDPGDLELVRAVQAGLPLVSRPYAEVAERIGMSEQEVMVRLGRLLESGDIRRLGVVVRHRELGYRANAMVVWDVPDERVTEVGRIIGRQPLVNLCYRRPRRPPRWHYNLFCMIHGRSREGVLKNLADMVERCGLEDIPHRALFSLRRFKQRGARYGELPGGSYRRCKADIRAAAE